MHGVLGPLRFRQEVLDGPRPVATPRRLPASAPVSVCLYKISDQAGDVWDSFQDQDIPLWQIQMDHPAQRPITFQMRDGMNDFLRNAHASDADMPTDVRALEEAVGVRLVVSDRTDPEDVGFVQWRVAFYLAGDLNNFLLLLDDFFVYKAKAIAREQPFQVQIFTHTGVEVTVGDDFTYEHVELME